MAPHGPAVRDWRIVRFLRQHPDATARDVAQHFYTVNAQLQVGSRLKRMVRDGLLVERFEDGWKYSTAVESSVKPTTR